MEAVLNDKQTITIIVGKSFSMSGVNDIRGFDEEYVVLDTSSGRITVEGKDLKIESLNKDGGNIYIKGNITGLFCANKEESKKGFIKRLFG